MSESPSRRRWAVRVLVALLVGAGLGILFPSSTPFELAGWLSGSGDRPPSVSAAPPGASEAIAPQPVKAFAEIDGRLYRIIVASRPGAGSEANSLRWSAAVSDEGAPR